MTTKEELHEALMAWAATQFTDTPDGVLWRAWNEAWDGADDEVRRLLVVSLAARSLV